MSALLKTKTYVLPQSDHVHAQAQGQFSYHANPATLWPDFLIGQADKPLRVILVEEDASMRSVIAQELTFDNRIDLIATATTTRDATQMIARYDFDVLLIDSDIDSHKPGDSNALIKHMQKLNKGVEIIVMSSDNDELKALNAFECGATGFLVKNSWFGDFAQAILQVANGGAFISPLIARRLLQKMAHPDVNSLEKASNVTSLNSSEGRRETALSAREKEILAAVAIGYTGPQIAEKLNIAAQTVAVHIKNIFHKLQVHTRAQAVTVAKSQGLLS
jgi:DNA-binding NarL/FixJ family response regulator